MRDGAEREFAEFYDATWGRTVACTYAMTGDLGTAEELAQEAYTRAWSRWSRLTTYDEPGAWVRQVATRLAISRWRRSKVAQAWLARNRQIPVALPPARRPESERSPEPCLRVTSPTLIEPSQR